MKQLIVTLLCMLSLGVYSQNRVFDFSEKLSRADAVSGARSTITYDELSRRSLSAATGSDYINGYKICVFFDNSQQARELANGAVELVRAKFPKLKAEPVYAAPIWKVFAGECVTKAEANNLLSSLKVHFPKAFIVNEKMPITLFTERLSYDPTLDVEELQDDTVD